MTAGAVAQEREVRQTKPFARDERSGPPIASRGPRAGDNQWFRLSVGREGKADPKWLVPLLCRRGAITKADIGAIRIAADETLVEIAGRAAGRFAVAVRRPDKQDRTIQITPAQAPAWDKPRRPAGDQPYKPRSFGEGAFRPKPRPAGEGGPSRFKGPPSRRRS